MWAPILWLHYNLTWVLLLRLYHNNLLIGLLDDDSSLSAVTTATVQTAEDRRNNRHEELDGHHDEERDVDSQTNCFVRTIVCPITGEYVVLDVTFVVDHRVEDHSNKEDETRNRRCTGGDDTERHIDTV